MKSNKDNNLSVSLQNLNSVDASNSNMTPTAYSVPSRFPTNIGNRNRDLTNRKTKAMKEPMKTVRANFEIPLPCTNETHSVSINYSTSSSSSSSLDDNRKKKISTSESKIPSNSSNNNSLATASRSKRKIESESFNATEKQPQKKMKLSSHFMNPNIGTKRLNGASAFSTIVKSNATNQVLNNFAADLVHEAKRLIVTDKSAGYLKFLEAGMKYIEAYCYLESPNISLLKNICDFWRNIGDNALRDHYPMHAALSSLALSHLAGKIFMENESKFDSVRGKGKKLLQGFDKVLYHSFFEDVDWILLHFIAYKKAADLMKLEKSRKKQNTNSSSTNGIAISNNATTTTTTTVSTAKNTENDEDDRDGIKNIQDHSNDNGDIEEHGELNLLDRATVLFGEMEIFLDFLKDQFSKLIHTN